MDVRTGHVCNSWALQWRTWVMQLLESGGSGDVLSWFSFLSLALFGVTAAAQGESVKSSTAPPRFWWTEDLMWNFSAANLRYPHNRSPISALPKGSQTDCMHQPPTKILPLHISAAGSCSDSALGGGGRSSTQIASSSLPLVYLVVLGNVLVLLLEDLRVKLLKQKHSPSPLYINGWLLPVGVMRALERHPGLYVNWGGLHLIREQAWHNALE